MAAVDNARSGANQCIEMSRQGRSPALEKFGSIARGLVVCTVALQILNPAHSEDQATVAASAASAAGGESAGTHKKTCRPEYPAAALKAKAQGTTVVGLTIAATGAVAKAEILQSAGPTPEHQLLDQAAAAALQTCTFKPRLDEAGGPMGTTVKVEYRWLLEPPSTPR